jgi:hypothetical protein
MLLNAGATSAFLFAKIIEKYTATNRVSFSPYGYELKASITGKLLSNSLPSTHYSATKK